MTGLIMTEFLTALLLMAVLLMAVLLTTVLPVIPLNFYNYSGLLFKYEKLYALLFNSIITCPLSRMCSVRVVFVPFEYTGNTVRVHRKYRSSTPIYSPGTPDAPFVYT